MSPLKKQNSFEEKLKDQLDGMELKPSDSLWSRIEQNIQADSFEPTLQQKLENYSLTPNKEVWEGVEAQLPETRRRKGIIWFSSIAVLLLATFGAGYWFRNIEETKNLAYTQKQAPAKTEQVISAPNTSNEAITKPSESAATQASPAASVIVKPSNSTNSESSDALVSENTAIQPNSALAQSNTSHKELTSSPSLPKKSTHKNVFVAAKNGNSSKAKNKKAGAGSSASGIVSSIAASGGSNQSSLPPSDQDAQAIPPASANTAPIASAPKTEANVPSKTNEPKVILESATINPQPKDTFTEDKIFREKSYITPEENFGKFSLVAYAGVHYTDMKLSMPTSTTYSNLDKSFQLRKEMESPSLDFSGGLMLNYHINKSWFVAGGIGISAFKQNVNFSVLPANQTNPTLVQDKNLYVNLNDSIIVGKTNSYENKYSFTEIPLWVGYQFKSESSFHFELMAGASFGKLNLVNVYMPDPGCIGILVANDRESFPQFKNVIFANVSPSFVYSANSSVEIGASPTGKFALNSMVQNTGWIQQRPISYGLNFFLRKRF
ncbi:MAG: hypothetical protein CFE21_01270 [Bacteroidetes bacterium B1(2017)]|nr:MAG: hypothetical protein CFE21_01270 [Bacteroidetes bacterium B1(2017)]